MGVGGVHPDLSETSPRALDAVCQTGVCSILPKPFTANQLALALNATVDYLTPNYSFDNAFDLEAVRVLLVDDSPNARSIHPAGAGKPRHPAHRRGRRRQRGAAVLDETMVDLIVTDYNMPEMDGREFVEYVQTKSWQRTVPILMVTSESNEGRLAAVEEAGVSGICDKPFEPSVVRGCWGGCWGLSVSRARLARKRAERGCIWLLSATIED